MAKLNVRAFGLSCGIVWALGILIANVINMYFGWGKMFFLVMSSIYIGLKPTVQGTLIGMGWAFADAGIAGVVIAWLYNKFTKD